MYKLQNKKLIGEGCCSHCYLLEDGTVYKKFKYPLHISDIDFYHRLSKYQNESFCLPMYFIFRGEKFYGYVMPKALGSTIEKCFNNSNLIDMSKNSILLEKNIDYVSSGKVLMYDFHSENLMYDGKKFTVIDFDEYCFKDLNEVEEIHEKNNEFYRIMISNLFIDNLVNDKYKRLIVDKLLPLKYSKIKTNELIIEMKFILDKFYKEDINSMDDIKRITSR